MKLKYFCITNTISGVVLGNYPGHTPREALDNLAKDAGYASYDDMDDEISSAPGELEVIEVNV